MHALSVYSEEVFSKIFAAPVMRLADDEMSEVRVGVAQALPQLAPWGPSHLLFEPALAKLRAGGDEKVREVMEHFVRRA